MPDQFKISQPPTDILSAVKFQPNSSQIIGVSSWDCSVNIYDVSLNSLRTKYSHPSPVLDFCFQDASNLFIGGLDCSLRCYDCAAEQETSIGQHQDPICKVVNSIERQIVITGGWDAVIRMWDPRASPVCVGQAKQADAVYSMDTEGNRLVVGTAGRRVLIWDLRQMASPEQQRESSLRYQTRCIRCFPNLQGYVLSSIEGRVAVEFFDNDVETQKKKYAFKCHRIKEEDTEKVFTVDAIAFHKKYNTFATGGSDGYVNIWDGFNRKRLVQLHKFPSCVQSLAFSDDGTALAIVGSASDLISDSTTEHGDQQNSTPPDPYIIIRYTSDQEVKPKNL